MKKLALIFIVSAFAVFSINAQSEQMDAATGTKAVEKVRTETSAVQQKAVAADVKEVQAAEKRKVSKEDAMQVKQIKKVSTDVEAAKTAPTAKKAGCSPSAKKACCASAAKDGKACCSSKKMSGKSCSKYSKTRSASKEPAIEQ